MPLRVKTLVEPATERSRSIKPILAESDEYYRLYRDLQRYTTDQIAGRSYLIAGHRGSGKTILVHSAIEELWRNSQGLVKRPLLVRLYGPDLLPRRKEPQSPVSAKENGTLPPTNQIAIAFSGDSPASVATLPQREQKDESDPDLKNVLIQLTKGLVRDVTNEYRTCFREAILSMDGLGNKQDDLLELAAQLELEVAEPTNSSRLRSFWQRIGKLQDGILFRPRGDSLDFQLSHRPDAGVQEILVLSFVSQAYQVVSGKLEEKEKQTDEANEQQASSISTAYALKDVFAPLIGLVSGGAVGVTLGVNGSEPLTSVALGLLAGGAVSFGFSFSSARSRSKETTLETTFIKDRSVTTLSSAIPLLIRRLKAIGLAPIFVVDEMDKVDDLETRMPNLIHHFKYLLTENSFFCFLADRRYLTFHNQQASRSAYSPEYTYFSNALLVLYEPRDLRGFVMNALEAVAPIQQAQNLDPDITARRDREDMEKIAYILLHRARLHPMELRRHLDRLAYQPSFSVTDFRDGYPFEVLIQLAIESLLESADVRRHIDAHPHNRQLIYDALYYISRLWEDASDGASSKVPGFRKLQGTTEKRPGFALNATEFTKYMKSRYAAEDCNKNKASQTATPADATTEAADNEPDFQFLFALINELVNLLSNPQDFQKRLFIEDKIPAYVLNVIPKTPPFESQGKGIYRWLIDISGAPLVTGEINKILGELTSPVANINEADKSIRSLGIEEGLQILSDLAIIPRTPDWRVVRHALDRIKDIQTRRPKRIPTALLQDKTRIVEFAGILNEFLQNVKGSLVVASLFTNDAETSKPHDARDQESVAPEKYSEVLKRVSRLMGLSASQVADLDKINSVLGSVPQPFFVDLDDDWTSIVNLIRDQLKMVKPVINKDVVSSMWTIYRDRFIQHFRDGTAQFLPTFGDIQTSSAAVEPGRSLSPDLKTLTASDWTKLLAPEVSEDETKRLPEWVRVAAAVELGLHELAEKLAKRLTPGDQVPLQWAKHLKDQIALQGAIRHGTLILAAGKSITSDWKPSTNHGALIASIEECGRLMERLRKEEISGPPDFPIDLVYVELAAPPPVSELVTQRAVGALSSMTTAKSLVVPTDVEGFLGKLDNWSYIVSEPVNLSSTPYRVFVSPKGLDDLIELSSGSTRRSAS